MQIPVLFTMRLFILEVLRFSFLGGVPSRTGESLLTLVSLIHESLAGRRDSTMTEGLHVNQKSLRQLAERHQLHVENSPPKSQGGFLEQLWTVII